MIFQQKDSNKYLWLTFYFDVWIFPFCNGHFKFLNDKELNKDKKIIKMLKY